MNYQRVISLGTLLCFLPLAVGCSTQRTIELDSDPATTAEVLDIDQPTTIRGFTTRSNGYQKWNGHVQATSPDSLLFTQRVTSGNAAPVEDLELVLARADVSSIHFSEAEVGKSILAAVGIGTLLWVSVVGIAILSGDFLASE